MTRPHAITLRADLPSPFAPRSDEVKTAEEREKEKEAEKQKDAAGKARKEAPEPLRVDLAGIRDRIVPFPVAPSNVRGLRAVKGKVYWLSFPTFDLSPAFPPPPRKADKTWGIAEPREGLKVGDGALKLDGLRMEIDPRAEWRQIFAETWRV